MQISDIWYFRDHHFGAKTEKYYFTNWCKKKCYITIWCKIVIIYDSYYHGKKHLVLISDNLVQDRDKFGAKPEKFQEIFGAKSI